MNILGLDISTHCGYALFNRNGALVEDGEWHYPPTVKPAKDMTCAQRLDRWLEYANRLDAVNKLYPIGLAVVEGYGYANKHNLATLVELGTVLRCVLYSHDIPMIDVAPNSLKKFVTGKGNAGKTGIGIHVFKRWGYETMNDNAADAYGLAMLGRAIMGENLGLPKANMEVVDNIQAKVGAEFIEAVLARATNFKKGVDKRRTPVLPSRQ